VVKLDGGDDVGCRRVSADAHAIKEAVGRGEKAVVVVW
jgi:hypothetical protein